MRRTAYSLILIILVSQLGAACAYRSPDAGHEAVLIDKPWLFGHGGVQDKSIAAGSALVWSSTDAVYVNMQPQGYNLDLDDINAKGGVPVDFNAQATIRVTDSVRLVRDFGLEWYKNNVARPYESSIRRAVGKYAEDDLVLESTIAAIEQEVTAALRADVAHLPIEVRSVTIGKANPPQAIKDQRAATAAQRQRQQTEIQGKLAEDQRRARELSRAAADNAYREAMNLSPTQFLELKRFESWVAACQGGVKCIVGNVNGVLIP